MSVPQILADMAPSLMINGWPWNGAQLRQKHIKSAILPREFHACGCVEIAEITLSFKGLPGDLRPLERPPTDPAIAIRRVARSQLLTFNEGRLADREHEAKTSPAAHAPSAKANPIRTSHTGGSNGLQ